MKTFFPSVVLCLLFANRALAGDPFPPVGPHGIPERFGVSVVEQVRPPGGHPEVPGTQPDPEEARYHGSIKLSTKHLRETSPPTGTMVYGELTFRRAGKEETKGVHATLAQWRAFVAFARTKRGEWAEHVLVYRDGLWLPARLGRPEVDLQGVDGRILIPVTVTSFRASAGDRGRGEGVPRLEAIPLDEVEERVLPFFERLQKVPADPHSQLTYLDGPPGHAPIPVALLGTYRNTEAHALPGFDEGDVTAVVMPREAVEKDVARQPSGRFETSAPYYLLQLESVRFGFGAGPSSDGKALSPEEILKWLSKYGHGTLTLDDEAPLPDGPRAIYNSNFLAYRQLALEMGLVDIVDTAAPIQPRGCAERVAGPQLPRGPVVGTSS